MGRENQKIPYLVPCFLGLWSRACSEHCRVSSCWAFGLRPSGSQNPEEYLPVPKGNWKDRSRPEYTPRSLRLRRKWGRAQVLARNPCKRLFDRPEAQFVVFEPAVGIERSQACKKASQTGFEDPWGPMCWHPWLWFQVWQRIARQVPIFLKDGFCAQQSAHEKFFIQLHRLEAVFPSWQSKDGISQHDAGYIRGGNGLKKLPVGRVYDGTGFVLG